VAAQLTLALNAEYDRLTPDQKKALGPPFSDALKKLYEQLQFSRDGLLVDSPTAFDRKEFAKQWQEAAKLLAAAK
jgi:hypothetical protein